MSENNTPGYARPSVSSRLPDYANKQAEVIRAAFVPGSYTSISSIQGGTLSNGEPAPFRAGGAAGGTFSEFAYMCSPSDLTDEERTRLRRAHEEKQRLIAGSQPFFAGYSVEKQKYEDTVYEYIPDPYDAKNEKDRQLKFLGESKALSRPFIPPGRDKALEKPTRVLLGDVMTALHNNLQADWPDAEPTVLSTAEDLIVVYFSTERARNAQGILTYMNNALRRNQTIQEFDLRKVPEGWDIVTEDNHLMYTFRPPWVRVRNFLSE